MELPQGAGTAIDEIDRMRMEALIKESRLSIPPILRIPLASTLSFVVGMGLGTAHGSKMAGLRFRAEHAHKLPNTATGWFLYHKTKNYHVANGGIREGLKMGTKLSVMTTATFAIENMFDTYRGTKDFLNTVIACVSVAGGFSLWSKLGMPLHLLMCEELALTFASFRSVLPADHSANDQISSPCRPCLRGSSGPRWHRSGPEDWIRRISKQKTEGHVQDYCCKLDRDESMRRRLAMLNASSPGWLPGIFL